MSDLSISTNNKRVIFQVHCGRWQRANIIDHPGTVLDELLKVNWKHLKQTLAVTHIYLLGIWENEGPVVVQEEGGKDISSQPFRSPSPFAITHHTMINRLIGNAISFDRLLTCFHALGLKVIVDFVPNHTGLGHQWLIDHPEYYKKDAAGKIKMAFSGDVAVLDYENPVVVKEMIRVLSTIASFGCDGVRCDMAHLIPLSFWKSAIETVNNEHPRFSWLAEAYSDSVFDLTTQKNLMKVGFDGVYDEPLYRNLKSSSRDTLISNFLSHFNYVLRNNNESWLHYVMNHDDSFPLASDHFLAWFCLTSLLPGWLLIYNGSLWGRVKRLSHHWVDLLSDKYLNLDALPEFYRAWFRWIRDENPQITQVEEMTSIVKLTWQGNNTRGLVYFNLSGTSQDGFAAYKNIIFTSNMSASLFEPYQVVVTM